MRDWDDFAATADDFIVDGKLERFDMYTDTPLVERALRARTESRAGVA